MIVKAPFVKPPLTAHHVAVSPPFDCCWLSPVYFQLAVNPPYGVFQTLTTLWKMAIRTWCGSQCTMLHMQRENQTCKYHVCRIKTINQSASVSRILGTVIPSGFAPVNTVSLTEVSSNNSTHLICKLNSVSHSIPSSIPINNAYCWQYTFFKTCSTYMWTINFGVSIMCSSKWSSYL